MAVISPGGASASSPNAGGTILGDTDAILYQQLVELRILNMLFAQAFGLTDDLAGLRNDPDLANFML